MRPTKKVVLVAATLIVTLGGVAVMTNNTNAHGATAQYSGKVTNVKMSESIVKAEAKAAEVAAVAVESQVTTEVLVETAPIETPSVVCWVDNDGDGFCDNLDSGYCNTPGSGNGAGTCGEHWVDHDGDGICDNSAGHGGGHGNGNYSGGGHGGGHGNGNYGGGGHGGRH